MESHIPTYLLIVICILGTSVANLQYNAFNYLRIAWTFLANTMSNKWNSDLAKVVNCPQAENSELYNVLKIAGLKIVFNSNSTLDRR